MTNQERAEKKAQQKLLREQMARIRTQARKQGRRLTTEEQDLLDEAEDHIQGLQSQLDGDSGRRNARTLPGNGAILSNRTGGNVFAALGQQMAAVAQAGTPGGQTDPRLYNAATGLSETVPSEGGFLVQQDFTDQLLAGIQAEAVLMPRCNSFPISGGANGITLPAPDETSRATGSRWGGVTGYWLEEAGEITASKPTFRKLELSLKKLACLVYTTDELLADAAALETFLAQAATAELAFLLDDAILNGTGAGMPLGILNAGCLVTVAKESGQTADTVVYENIVKMFSRMPARNRKNAAWFINQAIEPQLFTMSLTIGSGGSAVYLPAGGASAAPYASLLGRPVIPIEQAAALGDLGDVVFADMGSYILGQKGGVESQMSIHVRFSYDESVFRFVLRVDGQPAFASALTPFKGSDTLSPFITLESRA